ncbi:hypothetical protein ACH5RR_040407 [Cinchona calisaya]|uniref:Uncharacterized protein n=1 Tax=Cinchona calisaya TaxID=153742 RepID=A0ABD2XUD3_9GENT
MPRWITHLQDLVRISLICSELRQDPLESLQHLPNLVQVILKRAYQGEGLCFTFKAGGFLKLKDLYLEDLKRLRWMRAEEGAILQEIPLLKELPLGQLQKQELAYMSS